ncbi:MAG: xanthine phosphoribosyltransferase, partial [Bacilli bacterium]|nr:xanthine phosphoribosyltransferase [Bacilli bacterium]
MKALEDKILQSGTVIDNKILKVDNFFNYQIDT